MPLDVDADLTIEEATEHLAAMCCVRGSERGVLVVDSIQTVRSASHDERMREPRQRIDATMQSLRGVRAKGHLVIVTSEVPRGYYGDEKRIRSLRSRRADRSNTPRIWRSCSRRTNRLPRRM